MIEPYGFTKEKQEVIDKLIDDKVEDLVNDHVRFSPTRPKSFVTDRATSSVPKPYTRRGAP